MLIKKYFKNLKKEFQNHKFTGLSFSTNDVQKGFIFFCIKGNKVDGKKFISKAIKNGAKTIISDLKFEGYKNDVLFLKSKDTRELLSKIASKIYNKKPKNLIAVTGTNGKSSIADFFFQILKLNNKRVASIGTLGRTTLAASSGAMVDWLNGDWGTFFIITAVMVIPSLIFLYIIKNDIKLSEK